MSNVASRPECSQSNQRQRRAARSEGAVVSKEDLMIDVRGRIKHCRLCPGMNVPGVTQSAPGYGSLASPVVIVGQSLCNKCMETGIPFTGGSGTYIDKALVVADREKSEIFTTNLVHCHPEDDVASEKLWIENCKGYLHRELAIIKPILVVGLGDDAENELREHFSRSTELPWPFTDPPKTRPNPEAPFLLFPEHPGSLRFKKTPDRAHWAPSLGAAIRWAFESQ